ncbi:hypothetical protein L484_000990 [Morus notabilis]|uniref:Uncharacterized protein n=1 Tax=Morus notabilis TaxID=981085 RepID=W9RB01_9ROSA|nr:hypothetical protein L484_000990 [Morus notabilis]
MIGALGSLKQHQEMILSDYFLFPTPQAQPGLRGLSNGLCCRFKGRRDFIHLRALTSTSCPPKNIRDM